jgi:hypothetical protein
MGCEERRKPFKPFKYTYENKKKTPENYTSFDHRKSMRG